MESTRQQKISRLIQKDMGEILRRETNELFGQGTMLSVTKVYVTKDLAQSRIYISIFGKAEKEFVIKTLEANQKHLRLLLGNNVKNQLRVIPELLFFNDDSLDYLENIENLLKK